jgi:acetyl esterase/lipase
MTTYRLPLWTLAVALWATPAVRADAPVANKAVYDVESHQDIAYHTGGEEPKRNMLDVYVPKGAKDFPVLFFVHGGTWRSGNKEMYSSLIGETFAAEGIGAVVINYRLSPKSVHPAHIEDVSRAFAWTHANIAKYGGRADRVFAFGHSAGGHLVALLATDEKYLKAEKLTSDALCGVIGMSGVYTIDPSFDVFKSAFGKDAEVCKLASPLNHVSAKRPPFLLMYADKDMPYLDKLSEDMHAALKKADNESAILKLKETNHYTIITNLMRADDPGRKAIEEFVADHCKAKLRK